MTTLAFDHAALRFAQRTTARDALRLIRRRMPVAAVAPDFDGAALRLSGFIAGLLPVAGLSWMFIAC